MEINVINNADNIRNSNSLNSADAIKNTDWNSLWQVNNVKSSFADFLTPHAPCINPNHDNYGIECDANGLPVGDEAEVKAAMIDGLPTFMMNIGGWAQDMVNEIEEK
ncbi:MAG: hypothetical protein V4629_07240 [Pseudomonadota bacterium]